MSSGSSSNVAQVYQLVENASHQAVGDGAVILMTDTGQLYSCNEITERFLEHLDGKRSLTDIAEIIASQYEVDLPTAIQDLQMLTGQLVDEGIIRAND